MSQATKTFLTILLLLIVALSNVATSAPLHKDKNPVSDDDNIVQTDEDALLTEGNYPSDEDEMQDQNGDAADTDEMVISDHTVRRACIEAIRKNGYDAYAKDMADTKRQTIKK